MWEFWQDTLMLKEQKDAYLIDFVPKSQSVAWHQQVRTGIRCEFCLGYFYESLEDEWKNSRSLTLTPDHHKQAFLIK